MIDVINYIDGYAPAFLVFWVFFVLLILIEFMMLTQIIKSTATTIIVLLFVIVLYFKFILLELRDYAFAHITTTKTTEYYTNNYKNINCNGTIVVEKTITNVPYGLKAIETTETILVIQNRNVL